MSFLFRRITAFVGGFLFTVGICDAIRRGPETLSPIVAAGGLFLIAAAILYSRRDDA